MRLRVCPYFVNRLWTLCAASVGASFARDIASYILSERVWLATLGERSRAKLAPTEEKTVNAKNFTPLSCYN